MDLIRADPAHPWTIVTVTEAAASWGFVNLGRFAAAYRAAFGEHPPQAPRSGATPGLAHSRGDR